MSLQNWRKKGRIFDPEGASSWFVSHAALPVVMPVKDQRYRLYFSGRDAEGRAQIGYFDFDLANPGVRPQLSESPVITIGALGAFDDRGVTSSCTVAHADRLYQYYTGWNLGVTVPFYLNIGLAVSEDGGNTFEKLSAAPVLGRSAIDPYLTASPSVLIENGTWRMWYVSAVRWAIENGQPKHYYHIRYAESRDGICWRPTGKVCIDFASADEYAIARPCVLREANRYRMWYCSRGAKYRIGYAESQDGLKWERKDAQAGIAPSVEGWDSEEVSYPFVFRAGGRLCMCYNGNGYGKTGIGLAVLEEN